MEFALGELQLEGVEAPSMGTALAMCRSVLAAGKAVHAGMHTLPGVVRCVVLDGEANGFVRGEYVIDVRCDEDVAPGDVRDRAREWLDGDGGRGVLRVREANVVDAAISWWRWRWRRRRLARAVRLALNRG